VTIADIVANIPAHLVYGAPGWKDITIDKVVAGDLMSDILVTVETDMLLVTSLATDQAVRSADMVGSLAVLLVNDKLPTQGMRALAEDSGITLLATPMPLFETCVKLGSILNG